MPSPKSGHLSGYPTTSDRGVCPDDEYEPVSNCMDRNHAHFWFPENWPGGRAPVRWVYQDRSEKRQANPKDAHFIKDFIAAEVWVDDCCVGPQGNNLWFTTQSVPPTPSATITLWRKFEAELQAERDEILDARDALDELRFNVRTGALPG